MQEKKECGDGLSVVKILWRIKRNQVTVSSGFSERFWNVCIGSGIALGSQRSSRGPWRRPLAAQGPGAGGQDVRQCCVMVKEQGLWSPVSWVQILAAPVSNRIASRGLCQPGAWQEKICSRQFKRN